jgi:hypothetical protein
LAAENKAAKIPDFLDYQAPFPGHFGTGLAGKAGTTG